MKENYIVKSQREVALLFGVTVRTVRNWVIEGMPGVKGEYPLKEIIPWRIDRLRRSMADPEKLKWEVDLKESKAKLARLKYDIKTGKFLEKEEVERQWVDIAMAFKQELLGLPHRVVPQLQGQSLQRMNEILKKRIWEIFDNLAALAKREDFKVTEKQKRRRK